MRKKFLLIFFTAIFIQQVVAQQTYNAATIPAILKPRANAVVRNLEKTVHMQAVDQVLITVKKVITVLNKNGDDDGALHLFYNKSTTIKTVKGEIYNADGLMIGKFNLSNFNDESAISPYSLFEDDRIKYYRPQMTTYPYTVVYTYEIRNKQNLLIPDWYVNPDAHVSVEKTSYRFICQPTDKLNIKQYLFSTLPVTHKDEKTASYTWQAENIPAYRDEPYSLPSKQTLSHIKIAPEKFSYYKSTGSYSNWKELGQWMYDDLIQHRQELSPATIQMIKDLVKGLTDPKAKAKKIYEFVQNKTRYVSVQEGIGGFQPILASEVDQLGYGDCKGLVNYMQSLLKAVDIPSYYCVVNAGGEKNSLDLSYASMNQANHIILALPFQNDTTWLECTSQTAPFGYLGDFTDDRVVLACTSEGGKLLRTPALKTEQNLTLRKAELHIDQQGSVNGIMTTLFKGSQYDNNEHLIKLPENEQLTALKRKYDVDNINFSDLKFKQLKNADPLTEEYCNVNIKNYVSRTSNRAYLIWNAFNKTNIIPEISQRTKELYLNRGYTDEDEIKYHLPEGFIMEAKPQDIEIKNEYGYYKVKTTLSGNLFMVTRKLVINEGVFPASKYAIFNEFINTVNRNDHGKIVFSVN